MESNSVAVLILFFEKKNQTIKCIKSFINSPANIYVLNNGSSHENWADLKKCFDKYSNISFFNSNVNLGPSKGRNVLLRKVTEDWIMLVDNDITIAPQKEWHSELMCYLSNNPNVQIVCPKLYNVNERHYDLHPNFVYKSNSIDLEVCKNPTNNYFPSGASIVHKSVFQEYGLFEENIFAFEDYEYAIRALVKFKKPLEVFFMDQIELVHDHHYQKKIEDKKAVTERYDNVRLNNSFNFIQKTYQIHFKHDWEWWSKRQITEMTKMNRFKKLKRKIHTLLKK